MTGPLDPLMVRLKIAGYGGLALSVPIIMWEIWRFVVPGLHQRRTALRVVFFVLGSIVLFVMGAVVAWFTVEKALDFLLGIGGPGLRPLIAADKYLTLVMLMFAAFGFSFEFPLLLMFLLLVGAVNTRSSATSGGSRQSGSPRSRRSSLPARTPSPYCSWPFLCTSSMRPSILIGRLMKR